ncbi:PHB depolymerase family esterase [Myceligenerans pegani]|uniref:Alpha/beta hydrolase n=1 Tax=Myceligenerans pegani TaxID=2776917 RepID=A0ABR9MYE8_9MICO|nr:PHB depolymerase family esterase [Myceligenerans sp. TRM 65318]MBE1876071.1 hypothetical protein [Myceligenerans sp. TRM 65318]MBE3018342.1 hypothetical protein [Myceligenerans sp. TRM 65318]
MRPVRLDDFPPGHPAWDLLLGATPFQASAAEPRLSFTTYVPASYRDRTEPLRLLVAVHGTGRRVEETRDRYAALADEQGLAVLAPLFPCGLGGPDDVHNYKELHHGGLRFDEALLAMVDEAARRWRIDTERFLLAGFSGGGQFAHRFAYLHPHRLRAVSVGAPGRVTLPDDAPWPLGLGGVRDRLGTEASPAGLADVPYQVVVGSADLAGDLLAAVADDPREARAGATRVDRALRLAGELIELGVPVETAVVPGAGHDADAVAPAVTDFLRRALHAPDPAR